MDQFLTEDEYEALERIAELAHEGHDRFAPRTCEREICREIARLMGDRCRKGGFRVARQPARPARQLVLLEPAAESLGVSVKSLRRWIAAGHLTAYRIGPRLIGLDLADLEAFTKPIPAANGRPGA